MRRLHPLVLILFSATWSTAVTLSSSLAVQCILGCFVFLGVRFYRRPGGQKQGLILASVPVILLYMGISLFFVTPHQHLLWRGPHIPGLGLVGISVESLTSSTIHGLRLWNLLVGIMLLFSSLRPEDVIQLLGRHFARFGLTVSMVVQMIPNLLKEYGRTSEVAQSRGVSFDSGGRLVRVRAQAMVYQTLFMNALDRSWTLAESMFTRGYGSGNRTFYRPLRFQFVDMGLMGAMVCSVTLSIVSKVAVQVSWLPVMGTTWLVVCGVLVWRRLRDIP